MVDNATEQLVAEVDEVRTEPPRTRDSVLVGPHAHRMAVRCSFLVEQEQVGFVLALGEIREMGPSQK